MMKLESVRIEYEVFFIELVKCSEQIAFPCIVKYKISLASVLKLLDRVLCLYSQNFFYKIQYIQLQPNRCNFMILSRKYTFSECEGNQLLEFQSNKHKKNRFKGYSEIMLTRPTLHQQSRLSQAFGKKGANNCGKKENILISKHYIQKMINKNMYTLDFFNKSSNKEFQTINIKHAKTKLIKKSMFQHFKEMNSFNGLYKQTLQQLTKQYQQFNNNQNQKLSNITSINNIKQSRGDVLNKNKRFDIHYSRNSVDSFGYLKSRNLLSLEEIPQEYSKKKNRLSHNILNMKKDEHKQNNEINKLNSKMRAILKKKEDFRDQLSKCFQIQHDCLKMQKDKNIQSQINTFAIYSEKMKYKLDKTKQKIQKIEQLQL